MTGNHAERLALRVRLSDCDGDSPCVAFGSGVTRRVVGHLEVEESLQHVIAHEFVLLLRWVFEFVRIHGVEKLRLTMRPEPTRRTVLLLLVFMFDFR